MAQQKQYTIIHVHSQTQNAALETIWGSVSYTSTVGSTNPDYGSRLYLTTFVYANIK